MALRSAKYWGRPALLAIGVIVTSPAIAETTLQGSPTEWRLEFFPPAVVEIRYAGSSCAGGKVTLSPSASDAQRASLRALIDSAQATGRDVIIRYENEGGVCRITGFEAAP